MQARFLKKKI